MASLADTRKTVLQIMNEVRNKLGLSSVADLSADYERDLLGYLNDVIGEISDFTDWQEQFNEIVVTASSSVHNYAVNISAVVKNIKEISFEGMIAPMRYETIENIRRWDRVSAFGAPRFWTITGVDVSSGNPTFRTYPRPGASQQDKKFNLWIYEKPPLYTSSDAATVPPFPSRIIVQGLLAYAKLDEDSGTPGHDYLVEYQKFKAMLEEAENRYNGDSGTDTYFRPSHWRR